jgi:(E)-4-hydroxy-3-methyl-but-2-enyl pyrophosphate reductase
LPSTATADEEGDRDDARRWDHRPARRAALVPDGATVVFSAHGVSPAVRAEADRRWLSVVDATCPLVTKVHVEARRFAALGDTVILVGHAGHEEVEGTLGEAAGQTVLVQDAAAAARVRVPDPDRVSYLTQTTLATDETAEVVDVLRARFPRLRGPASDDICYATTNRQDALRAIADESDVVLVVGSANSSNSRRLVELARRRGTPAYLRRGARRGSPARWLGSETAAPSKSTMRTRWSSRVSWPRLGSRWPVRSPAGWHVAVPVGPFHQVTAALYTEAATPFASRGPSLS